MTQRPTPRTAAAPAPAKRGQVLLWAAGALVLVVIAGLAVALLGDDDGGADATTDGNDRTEATFGPVTVDGTALAGFDAEEADTAIGQPAPVLAVTSPEGRDFELGGAGQPTLVTFLAHWCPHCQAELPVLVELDEAGAFQGVRTVAVLTGTDAAAPNYPPVPWLDREGWTGEVALDDEDATAAAAWGLTSYPFLVMLDADGVVTGRLAGEQPAGVVEELIATATG